MHIEIVEAVVQPRLQGAAGIIGNEPGGTAIVAIQIFDDDADSGTVSFRASSRSTGNLPIPHSFTSAARWAGLPRSTRLACRRNVVLVQAISAFQADQASGVQCSVSDMEYLPL